jgi:hypothetical protein
MGQVGSQAEYSLAPDRGVGAVAVSTVDGALAAGAITGAAKPFPGAEDFAVGLVTAIPAADAPLMAVHALSPGADAASVAADVASVEVHVASAAVDMLPVAVDIPLVEADTGEAEAVMVGAGRFHHKLETLAAGGICCRPLRFSAIFLS